MERMHPSHWIRDDYYPTLYSNGGRVTNNPYPKGLIDRHPSPGYFYSGDPHLMRHFEHNENRAQRTPRLKASPPVDMIKVEEGDLIPAYTWKKRQLEHKGRHTPEDRVYSSADNSEVAPWPASRFEAYNDTYRDRSHAVDNNSNNNYDYNNGKYRNNNRKDVNGSKTDDNANEKYTEKFVKKNIEKVNEFFHEGIKVEKDDDCNSSPCCKNSKSSNAQMLERLSKDLREEIVWPSHDLIVERPNRHEHDVSRDIDALKIREQSASPPSRNVKNSSPSSRNVKGASAPFGMVKRTSLPPGMVKSASLPLSMVQSAFPPDMIKSVSPPGMIKSVCPPGMVKSDSPSGMVKSDSPPGMVKIKVEEEDAIPPCGGECHSNIPISVDFIKDEIEDGEIVPSYERHQNDVSSPPLKSNKTPDCSRNNRVSIIKPNLPPPPPLRKIVENNLTDIEVAIHSNDINSSMSRIIEKGSKSIAATQNIDPFPQETFIRSSSPTLPAKQQLSISMLPERVIKSDHPSGGLLQSCKYCFCQFVPDPSLNIFVDRKRQHIFICDKCCETREDHLLPISLEEQEKQQEGDHQQQHEQPPPQVLHYKCDICDKLFSQKSNLQTHKRIHTGEKPFECGVCNKMFRDKSALIKHSQTHTFEKPYACFICGKSFSQKSNLRTHERIHTGERPFKCAICSKSFTDNSALIKHRRIHTGEKPYSCVKCDKRFCSLNYLNHHLKTHENEKTVSCTLCNKRFYSLKHLQIHFKIHTTEKLFQCKVCHKQFQTNNYLKIHERIHTGEKPFRCQICVKKFRDNSALKRHLKTHTGEKPHKCNICDRVFGQKSHLQAHLRTHTGEKPYKCHLCSKTFTQDSNLKSHQRVHMFSIKMQNDSEMRKMLLHNM